MVEQIDPKTVEAMKVFRTEAERANSVFQQLQKNMGQFTKDMDVVNTRTVDFNKNWKEAGRAEAAQVTPSKAKKAAAQGPEAPPMHVEIGTIRIDVSGVTDKTDKQKLAEDIGKRVARELKAKMGGPFSNSGYNRGV